MKYRLTKVALANAFIEQSIDSGTKPFRVAWYKSDTTQTINYLKEQVVDIGITYTIAAEEVAVEAGIVKVSNTPIAKR